MKIEISRNIMNDGFGEGWKIEGFALAQKIAAYYTEKIPEMMAGEDREIEISITASRDSGYCHQGVATVDGEESEAAQDEFEACLTRAWVDFCFSADENGDID